MRLYKYLQRQHLDAFFHKGSLRIGTLHEYRNVDDHGSVIGDADEGIRRRTLTFGKGDEVHLGGKAPEAYFLRNSLGASEKESANFRIVSLVDGYTFVSEEQSENLYVYCASATFDAAAMQRFGYDFCMEITNPAAFFSAISHRLRHRAQFHGLSPVQYAHRDARFNAQNQPHPALLKDPAYGYQAEWRAIWVPTKKLTEPLLIEAPRAIRYCRPYAP